MLLPYQLDAIQALLKSQFGIMVVLPSGTGKSVVAYKAIKEIGGPVFLCTCRYVIFEHVTNHKNFIPEYQFIHIKTGKETIEYNDHTVVCCTPTIMQSQMKNLVAIPFRLIILDESHLFKGWSKRTKAIISLSRKFPTVKKLLLTATPCPENIGELQPQMEILSPTILGTHSEFVNRYERKVMCGSFWKSYYVNQDEITGRCKPYVYSKKNIQLPPQVIKPIGLDMPAELRKLYNQALTECAVMLKEGKEIFLTSAPWQKLLQLCSGFIIDTRQGKIEGKRVVHLLNNHKIDMAKEIVSSLPQSSSIIVWSIYIAELDGLAKSIPNCKLIKGGVSNGQEILDSFKKKEFRVLVANPACIGAGVSLQVADTQIFVSTPSSGVLYMQSLARTRRIVSGLSTVYKLYYINTIETRLVKRVESKEYNQTSLINDIIDIVKTI